MDQIKFLDHPDLGKLLLRIGVGLVLFLHGLGRIEGGAAGTIGMVEGAGLPGWLAYGAHIGELVAPHDGRQLLVNFLVLLLHVMFDLNACAS